KRRDDQSHRVSEVLITVREISLYALDVAVVILPIIPQLGNPLESSNVNNAILVKLFHDILRMNINNNKCVYCYLLLAIQLGSNQSNEVRNLTFTFLKVFAYSIDTFSDCIFDF